MQTASKMCSAWKARVEGAPEEEGHGRCDSCCSCYWEEIVSEKSNVHIAHGLANSHEWLVWIQDSYIKGQTSTPLLLYSTLYQETLNPTGSSATTSSTTTTKQCE